MATEALFSIDASCRTDRRDKLARWYPEQLRLALTGWRFKVAGRAAVAA
jgi:hypothetical protein